MSDYAEYFLNSNSSVVLYETIELSHPNFSQVYRCVRNSTEGLTAGGQVYDYVPFRVDSAGVAGDLEEGLSITFGDLGEILPTELDNVALSEGFSVLPTLIYRAFRSDNLTSPIYGPITLGIQSFNQDERGATFVAKAESLNTVGTGEIYTINRFPMLRGFL